MRDKKKLLIILLCAAIVLGAACWFLLKPQDTDYDELYSDSAAEHEHEIDEGFIENAEGELLIDKNSEDIKSIVLKNTYGTYTIKRDSTTATLYIEELDRDIPLCDDFLEYVWYYGYCLGYNYKIVSTSDMPVVLSDYGLDTPRASFSIKYNDDTEVYFEAGDSLVSSDSVHYVNFKGFENTVFITELNLAAFQDESYFIDTDFFGISEEEDDVKIGTVTITGSSIPEKIVIEPYSSDDRSDQSYDHSHIITSPIRTTANDVNTTALVNELIYLAADSAVCSNPSKDKIAEYGLDKPSLILTFKRNGKKQVLSIGKTDKSTYCYAMLKGLDVIYNIDPVQAEAILSSSLSFYRSAELRKFSVNAAERITVSFGDESYTFDVTRTALTDDNEYYEYSVQYGENKISNDNYRSFLSVISGAYAINWDTKTVSDEASLTVKVKYFDSFGRKDDVLKFYEADFNRFVCSINGKKTANVSAIFLTKVMDAARKLAKNEEITL